MRIHPFFAIAVIGGAVALVSMLWDEKKPTGELKARARRPLSTLEQEVYWRLVQAFPGMVILAQVALTALMTTPRKDRSRYHHKVVDFVILDKALDVHAVIEIDDASQGSRHTVGEPVKELLEMAGYRVFEFAGVPEIAQLHEMVGVPPAAKEDRPRSRRSPPPAGAGLLPPEPPQGRGPA